MPQIAQKVSPTQHLHDPALPVDSFRIPPTEREVKRRGKILRLIFHSADRLAGSTATYAMFNVGNLAAQWGLDQNVDVGKVHYSCSVTSFNLVCANEAPTLVEVLGEGWPQQSGSWESASQGATRFLCVASSAITAWSDTQASPFQLTSVPSGRLGFRLISRDDQAGLDADATLVWHCVISISPVGE